MKSIAARFLLVLICVLVAASGLACNTIEGMGKDVERTGEAIRDAAK